MSNETSSGSATVGLILEPSAPAPIVNYFAVPQVAQRYAANRPSVHARILEILPRILAEQVPVGRALDVGCGTGHSTHALLPYAREIVGIDSSSEMLSQAEAHPQIRYRKGYAEAIPCRQAEFDLVTVASAYHWFDHDRFLSEAARVLQDHGWLVLYKAGSTGYATAFPEFEAWRRVVFNARYPKVARHDEPLTLEKAARFAFVERWSETFAHREGHSLEEYVENLLTRSSVIRMVAGGHESVADARAWLRTQLAPFFPAGESEFVHEARLQVLQRQPRAQSVAA